MRVSSGGYVLAGAMLLLSQVPAATRVATPCADERSHQFDFWVGELNVFAGDKQAGTNSITPILDGCVLQEKWVGSQGSAGTSLNFFNPSTGKWHQFWVWRNGTTLDLSGGFHDGKMILSGDSPGRDGKGARDRITWSSKEDGTIRQHWEESADAGKTWHTVFDGLYRRKH
ncbi:MAG: hypothetical protein ACE5IK_00220 [Acidobacteriota bacterium]